MYFYRSSTHIYVCTHRVFIPHRQLAAHLLFLKFISLFRYSTKCIVADVLTNKYMTKYRILDNNKKVFDLS